MTIDATKYPTLAKMASVQNDSQVIGMFLEWLQEKGMVICEQSPHLFDALTPVTANTGTLLARHFEVDLEAAERERRQVLAEFQQASKARARPA